jgi:polyphosphate kinase
VIQVHLVNENEDKIVSLLEKLKLLAIIVSDGDVLFKVGYSEMSNSF